MARVGEVFWAFLKLGLTSFGGPIAHLGYFRRELVERRSWLTDAQYAQLVSLCQFLPGPASSQAAFALGLLRAGWWGALAASLAFTTPSVLLLLVFANVLPRLQTPLGLAAIHGLKLLAVCVVARAVLGMAEKLTPDWPRRVLAVAAAALLILFALPWLQVGVIAAGGALGALFLRRAVSTSGANIAAPHGLRAGTVLLVIFAALLLATFTATASQGSPLAYLAASFYQAGALVFGGGHVVLPLLRDAVVAPGWVSEADFLAGYGAAQLVPGPLFSIAAYLGARLQDGTGGALAACVGIASLLLPGLLLVAGTLPWWQRMAAAPRAAGAVAGANAAVTGVLAAALYDPVWVSAVGDGLDAMIVALGLGLLFLPRGALAAAALACLGGAVLRAVA